MALSVSHVVTGPFQENSYVLACTETREGILVDPGAEAERIAALVEEEGVRPIAIWATHAHLDHVGAMAELQERYGIPAWVPEGDRDWIEALAQQAQMFGLPPPRQPRVDGPVVDGAEIAFGHVRGRVIATPGHTQGGSCFWFANDGVLITGDTLFVGSIGRTDLPGGDLETLKASIRGRLFALPDEVRFHPGHGEAGRLGDEKRLNPFVGERARVGLRVPRMP